MTRTLANRLSKLEAATKPTPRRVPHVLEIRHGETLADAEGRFICRYGPIPRGHRFLGVPPRDRTDEEHADFDVKFKAQQLALVAEARSARLASTFN